MQADARSVLDEAARRRAPCQVKLLGGSWLPAEVVRVERGGVVLLIPGLRPLGGENLRVLLRDDRRSYTFDAAVLRAGVPVPDRSHFGSLVGMISHWAEAVEQAPQTGLQLTVLPPTGRGIPLLGGAARLVDLAVDGLAFSVPQSTALKFVEGGRLALQFEVPGRSALVVTAQVLRVSSSQGHLLYQVAELQVGDAGAHLQAVEAFRALIG